jgi:microcystin-dependent protein
MAMFEKLNNIGDFMEAFLGSILLVPYNFTPKGWAPCDGRFLSIRENAALFSLLGGVYGGDLHTTFALPTLESPINGVHYIIATEGIYPSRP